MQLKKRVSALALAVVLALSATACSGTGSSSTGSSAAESASSAASSAASTAATTEKTTIKVGTLKGPTGLGMLKMMQDADAKTTTNDYKFVLDTAPTAAVAKLTSGEVDMAGLPTNLAASLYKKTNGKMQLLEINTLGVLSIVTNGETITSIQDLKGKKIVSSGKGSVPEYAFNYILKQNGLNPEKDVQVEYASEHAAAMTKLVSGQVKIAVLPEPFVTQTLAKCKTAKIALNMTDEWSKVVKDGSVLTMGCIVVRKDFAEKHKDAVNQFLADYKASSEYANQNAEATGKLAEKYLGMPAAVAAKAIPNCSLTFMDGDEMKAKVQPFFKIMYQENPQSIGGKLPDDGIYYQK